MISFMFAVLGSVAFWVLYSLISLVVTPLILKIVSPDGFKYIILKDKYVYAYNPTKGQDAIMLTLVILIFWPLPGSVIVIEKLSRYVVFPAVREGMIKMYGILPTVQFNKKETQRAPEENKND